MVVEDPVKKNEQGKRLRKLRETLGMTQKEFGQSVGLKWSQIKDRESGLVQIKIPLAIKIENAHGVNRHWLFAGEGEMMAGSIEQISRGGSVTEEHIKAVALTSKVFTSEHADIKNSLMKHLEQSVEAVDNAHELKSCKAQLTFHKKEIDALKDRIEKMDHTIKELLRREQTRGSDTS